MLAFGDLSPDETTRLEQEVVGDREASRILEQYRGMRTGLKAMADVPEHQLSTERLRHAVLNQGLKPKPRPQFGWLWMPSMAAVAAFAVMFAVRSQHVSIPAGPGVALNGSEPTDLIRDKKMDQPFAFATATAEISSVDGGQPAPAMMLAVNNSRPSRHRSDRALTALKEAVYREFLNVDSADMHPKPLGVAPASSGSTQPSGAPIVLIDSAKDSKTGAQKATEVDSANNVVVGG